MMAVGAVMEPDGVRLWVCGRCGFGARVSGAPGPEAWAPGDAHGGPAFRTEDCDVAMAWTVQSE
jgi:hypothetical protein